MARDTCMVDGFSAKQVARMDVYGLLEREDRRINRGACPVCNAEMPLADIEGHVNRCLDSALQREDESMARSLARTGHHPLADSATDTPFASPGGLNASTDGDVRVPQKHSSFSAEDHAYASLLLEEMNTKNKQGEFTDISLRDSDTIEDVPIFATKPGGYAVDMAELNRLNSRKGSQSPSREDKGKEKQSDSHGKSKDQGRRRILADSDDDEAQAERSSDSNNNEQLSVLRTKIETMSKEQLKKLCLRQHRKIKEMKFHIKMLEKDLKDVRVKQALNDDYQREVRTEMEKEYERQQHKAKKREAERLKREESDTEARELAAALDAVRRREELEKAEADAAAAIEAAENGSQLPDLVPETSCRVIAREWPPSGIEGNGIFTLPREVMFAILSQLTAADIANVMRTCKGLADSARDPLLWRQLFVYWIKKNKSERWGSVDDATIMTTFTPVQTEDVVETSDVEDKLWYSELKKRYEKWRYGIISGNGESWKWDRRQKILSGFSFCTRTHQRWSFDGGALRVMIGLIGHPPLNWNGKTLGIAFRPQKSFECREDFGIRDTFWNQQLWRFSRKDVVRVKKPTDETETQQEAQEEVPQPEPEECFYLATRAILGGPPTLQGPYRVQGEVPLPVVAVVLLQASNHLS